MIEVPNVSKRMEWDGSVVKFTPTPDIRDLDDRFDLKSKQTVFKNTSTTFETKIVVQNFSRLISLTKNSL
jgi:hypothetical protein